MSNKPLTMGDLFNFDGSRRVNNEEEYQQVVQGRRLTNSILMAMINDSSDPREKAQEATEDIRMVDSEGIC